MLKNLARSAHELEAWLHQHVGRPYIAILTWGLVLSMISTVTALGHALSAGEGGLTPLFVLVFQAGLLINQLAQWHELGELRRQRKEEAVRRAPAPGRSWPDTGKPAKVAQPPVSGQTAGAQQE